MESFSKISSMLGQARDLTIEAATTASQNTNRNYGARIVPTAGTAASSKEIRKFLASRYDRDILDGLRRVVAMMCRGHDCSEFFADVVKNVASPTLEIKKLVYIYLLQYAESEPDLSLLSINTIQKALNDQNQVVRSMAIRVMSGIRVPAISQIVALGIKKCVTDMSPYVRKAGALAIPKCYRLDPSTLPQLSDYIGVLLGDKSYYVVGAAVMAFEDVCPERLDLVHKYYRALCKMLIDMDEWGQLVLLKLLTVYVRKNIPKTKNIEKKKKTTVGDDAFYSDEEGTTRKGSSIADAKSEILDPDLELLLKSCPPLLQSRNSAVIVAVAKTYFHLAPSSYLKTLAKPLLSLLRAPVDIQNVALVNIVFIALQYPTIFAPYCSHFLLSTVDPPYIWKLKIEMLTLTYPYATKHHQNIILAELSFFASGYDKELVKESIKAMGRCAQNTPTTSIRCLSLLMTLLDSNNGAVVAESLTVIRHIIQQHPELHKKTVIKLAKLLDTAVNPAARSSIIWLVGEFAGVDNGDNIAADVLRILAKGFSDEADDAKLQIVLLAAKVYSHYLNHKQEPPTSLIEDGGSDDEQVDEDMHSIAQLFRYVARLARYDTSYDLRDRTRLYLSLLSTPATSQLATLILLAPKPVPFAPSPSAVATEGLTVGSAALMVGKNEYVRGYEDLPEWVIEKDAPSPKVRDPTTAEMQQQVYESGNSVSSAQVRNVAPAPVESVVKAQTQHQQQVLLNVSGKKEETKEKSLDEWLESSGEEEAEEEEESVDDEDDEEEEESSGEEEESEDDEESEESDESEGEQQESSKMLRS